MRRAVLAAVSLVLLAGCGGEDEAGGGAPPAAASPAATPEPEASGQSTAVAIEDFTFTPEEITVSSGEEVAWANADAANHNVVFDDDAQKGITNLREGQEDSVKFSKTGSFSYVCSYHPGMKGTVVVE